MINKAIKTLYTYNGIFVFATGLLGPLYAVYVQLITPNPVNISLTWAAFMISSTITMSLVSKFGDRVQEKEYLLMAGYLLRAGVWLAYIFVPNLLVLLLLQIILGVGEALAAPAYNAIFAEHLDSGRHVEEFSDQSLIFNLLTAIAAIVGGLIVNEVGFTPLFLFMSVLALVAFYGIWKKPRSLL